METYTPACLQVVGFEFIGESSIGEASQGWFNWGWGQSFCCRRSHMIDNNQNEIS